MRAEPIFFRRPAGMVQSLLLFTFTASLLSGAVVVAKGEKNQKDIRIEEHLFKNPHANFSIALSSTSLYWHDPDMTVDDLYGHAANGLITVLSYQDQGLATAIRSDLKQSIAGKTKFLQTVEIIKDKLHDQKISDETIYHYALKGLVRDLSFDGNMLQAVPPKDTTATNAKLMGEMVSIGVEFDIISEKLIITYIIPDSPAEQEGLLPGDRIIGIDGKSLGGKHIWDLRPMLHKPAGTIIHIEVERDSNRIHRYIKCKKMRTQDARGTVINDIGLIWVRQFSNTTYEDFLKQVARIKEKKAKGIILDLRGNSGGMAHAASAVACYFLSKGALLGYSFGRDRKARSEKCKKEGDTRTPLVVLADKRTASGGEVVAGALKDNGRAKVVGEKTKGYGALKRYVNLPNGYAFRVMTAPLFSPNMNPLYEEGLHPDVRINLSRAAIARSRREPDANKRLRKDAQLASAFKLLDSKAN